MSRRTERLGNLFRSTLGELLFSKLSDPRIEPGKTSITRVEMAEDLLTAKVYVSVMGTDADQRRTVRALQHAAGRIQELLARQIRLRSTPILQFVSDENFKKTLETYALIQKAMEEIRRKEDALAADDEGGEDENGEGPDTPAPPSPESP